MTDTLHRTWRQGLAERRKAAGLTQVELSRRCGFSRTQVWHIETRGVPTDAQRIALADALGLTVAELFPYPDAA